MEYSAVPKEDNMATNDKEFEPIQTMNAEQLISRLLPDRFQRNDDVDTFISTCTRYFKVAKIQESCREIFVIALLSPDVVSTYENVNPEIKGFENRLRAAFKKTKSRMDDLKEALEYRRTDESTEEYFVKVKKLAENLMKHTWNQDEIEKCLLLHCTNDKKVQKEVKMREVTEKEEMKKIIKKVDDIRGETDRICALKPTYARMVQRAYPVKGTPVRNNVRINDQIKTCWTCNKEGHISYQCPNQRKNVCYGCHKDGHIRRNCPNLTCTRCLRQGHRTDECYSKTKARGYSEYYKNGPQKNDEQLKDRFLEKPWSRTNDRRQENKYEHTSDDYRRGLQRGRQIALLEIDKTDEKNERSQDDEEPILAMQ